MSCRITSSSLGGKSGESSRYLRHSQQEDTTWRQPQANLAPLLLVQLEIRLSLGAKVGINPKADNFTARM